MDGHGHTQDGNDTVHESLCPSVYFANGAFSLLNLCT